MIRIAWYAGIVLTTLVVLALLWQFSLAIVLFLLSLAIAAAFRPVIDSLEQREIHRNLAMLSVYFLVIGLVFGLLFIFNQPLISNFQDAANDLAAGYEHIKSVWSQNGSLVQQSIAQQLPPPNKLYEALAGKQGMAALQAIFGVALNFFDLFGKLAIIIVLSMYWSADQVHFERLWLSLLAVEKRSRARDIWRAIERGVGAYIRSEFVQSLLTGLTLGLGYWAMGLKYAALLSLFGALARLIPWFGKILILTTAFAVGSASSLGIGILAASYSLLIMFALDWIIQPQLYSKKRDNSLLKLILVIALAYADGLIGLMLAGPLAIAIQNLLLQIFQTPSVMIPHETKIEISAIQERLRRAENMLDNAETSNSPEINNLLERVQALVEKTDQQLHLNNDNSP